MKKRGRRAPDPIFAQRISKQFKQIKDLAGGARPAAKRLGVSLASFYNYARGTDIPSAQVLAKANDIWDTRTKVLDTELLKAKTPGQLLLPIFKDLTDQNVEIAGIGPKGERTLELKLRIKFGG